MRRGFKKIFDSIEMRDSLEELENRLVVDLWKNLILIVARRR